MMKLTPAGDYYLWFCDWCDSQNRTLWTRMDSHRLTCGVCSRHVELNNPSTFAPIHGTKKQELAMPAI